MEIAGLSMAAHAQVLTDPMEGKKALRLLMSMAASRGFGYRRQHAN